MVNFIQTLRSQLSLNESNLKVFVMEELKIFQKEEIKRIYKWNMMTSNKRNVMEEEIIIKIEINTLHVAPFPICIMNS